ncbi:uncharacterized protein LOC124253943 [Haliotis rubra]|uniref:uncharacterized protein LOC124253943 n=1 Tax=Haliotis rubra TaxID=36100 RepID=UPI001EE57010|nr:uncharacterized protein LOC124253943 [Haliotis rubra]
MAEILLICCIGESDLKTTTLRSTLGKNTLKGVWVFLALVGQVVAPAALSSGQITVQVVEEPTNRVLNEYDVFMIQILMSRSLTSLEQDVPQSWSKITSYEEVSSSLLTLQRKLQEHDVLLTLIVLDTLPEFLNDDLVQRAVLKAWTTLEDEEELLENHFEEKTSRNKHVVLTNGSFQSLLTQLKGEPFDSDEVHSQLHSADSPSKLVIIDGEPQVLRFQEFQILFGIYVQHTLLNQQQLMKRKPQLPRRANGQSGSSGADIRKEAAAKSKVVLTKDAFQSLLKQVKLDTLQDEDHEPSHSQDVEVSASKVGLSKGRTTSPLMLQKEFLSKLVSQTMNTLHRQSTLHDQLMFLDGALDQDLPESLEETESPSKLVTPVMYQREFLSKILSQTMNTIYGESGLQDKLKMWDAMLELAFRKRLENTESPSKLINPVMYQREFLSKILSQTMNTLYGDSGFLDQVELFDGVLAFAFQEHLAKTELPNKLTTPIMYQREFIAKILSQTMSTLYGESGLGDELNFFDRVLDKDLPESLEETESPSKPITPVMHQRELLSKELLLTMSTLYRESGLQDKLKVLDGEDLTSMEHPDKTESLSKYNTLVMHQREFLSKILSQTMSTLYGEAGLQDQLKVLDGEALASLERPDKTESPSKLISPVVHQRELLSKELFLTMSKLYVESGLQEKLRVFNGILDLASLDHPEKTESPSKFITPVMYERESLSKELLQTMSTLYGESGLQDQLKLLDGEDLTSMEHSDETESLSKLITLVMHQRETLSKELFLTMSTLYGESGLQDQLKVLDGEDLASLERPDKSESPSKLISPVMYQREFLSKIPSQTMKTLYGESGLQDQLKMWDGVMDQTKYTVAASSQSFDGLKQDAWLSQEALRGGLRSAVGVKASASCNYKETHQVVQLYTDSCYRRSGSFTQRMAGLGGLWYDKLKYHVFSTAYSNPHKLHNNDLEMLAILVALNLHGRDWQGMNVEAYCDNESTVKLLNAYCDDTSLNVLKCKSRNRKQRSSKIQTFIINEINEEVCRYKFRLSTIQIGGKQNCRADMLSRRGIEEFSSHLPRGARYCEYNVMAELHSFDRSLESWMKTF